MYTYILYIYHIIYTYLYRYTFIATPHYFDKHRRRRFVIHLPLWTLRAAAPNPPYQLSRKNQLRSLTL